MQISLGRVLQAQGIGSAKALRLNHACREQGATRWQTGTEWVMGRVVGAEVRSAEGREIRETLRGSAWTLPLL